MADFFDQICKVIAETDAKRPGSLARGAVADEFFRAAAPAVPPTENAVKKSAAPAARAVPAAENVSSLETLCREVAGCTRCALHLSRNNTVFGEGSTNAGLMFIGEGPGFEEDRTGRPFVGKAGQLLDKMISAMQFSREEVYIANIVKCRPPDNRVPMPEEAAACLPYLVKQIELVSPKVIVLLGATAAHYLLGKQEGITRLRGRWLDYQGIPVMPTYHPAFLLRKPEAKREAWSDLQQVMAKFNKYHQMARQQ